ncbi:MAG: EthD family reductase [Spirochaetota bacterium]
MAQPVKVVALIKAKPGMTREQLKKRWVEEHCPLTIRMKRLKGYRVNIAIEEFQDIEGELPYDGTAELWWDSLEEMQEDFASDEGKLAGDDADSFTVVRMHLYTREYIIR